MRTLHLDTDRLPVVMLRDEFTVRTNSGGDPIPDADGELVYHARIMLPGGAAPGFGDGVIPIEAKVRSVGTDPKIPAGTAVRLIGRTPVTAWTNQERSRYTGAGITITPDRVEAAPGERVILNGFLPVKWNPAAVGFPTLVGEDVLDQADWAYQAHVILPAGTVESTAVIKSRSSVAHLLGEAIEVDLDARLYVPDLTDLGRNNKPDIRLYGSNFRAAGNPASTPPAPRRGRGSNPDPAPEFNGAEPASVD